MNTENFISLEVDTSILLLVKMSFIYNAVMDGWRVEKLSESKFIFSKKKVMKEITLKSFLNKYLINKNSMNLLENVSR